MQANQIAISVHNMRRSLAFYEEVFGLRRVHGTRAFRGPGAELVQGIPGVASNCQWMSDARDYFQLELFAFETPRPRPLPADRLASDIGYTRLALNVRELDGCMARARRHGGRIIGQPRTIAGRRHVALHDPDGILLEVIEAPALLPPGSVAQFAGIALSVPDLERARIAFCAGLGLPVAETQPPARDELWELPDTQTARLRLDAGTLWIELTAYRDARARSPQARLSDIGILNFALGTREADLVSRTYARALAAGFSANCEPVRLAHDLACVYLVDPQGFSVELLGSHPRLDRRIGFARPDWRARLATWQAEWRAYRAVRRARARPATNNG